MPAQFDSTPASIPVPSQYQNYMTGPPYTKVLLELHKCGRCPRHMCPSLHVLSYVGMPSSSSWHAFVTMYYIMHMLIREHAF